jgi:hypothetical protein
VRIVTNIEEPRAILAHFEKHGAREQAHRLLRLLKTPSPA